MMYPDAGGKGGRGKKDDAKNLQLSGGFLSSGCARPGTFSHTRRQLRVPFLPAASRSTRPITRPDCAWPGTFGWSKVALAPFVFLVLGRRASFCRWGMRLIERWRARWGLPSNFGPDKREQIIISVIGWTIASVVALAGIIATVGVIYVWYLAFIRGG
jgi:hypothetical protein